MRKVCQVFKEVITIINTNESVSNKQKMTKNAIEKAFNVNVREVMERLVDRTDMRSPSTIDEDEHSSDWASDEPTERKKDKKAKKKSKKGAKSGKGRNG